MLLQLSTGCVTAGGHKVVKDFARLLVGQLSGSVITAVECLVALLIRVEVAACEASASRVPVLLEVANQELELC